ncbi:MAG TPA: hypothetical protein VFL04_07980 [Rectinemataceae bacterium]|nr:hypothetical protein [Rectinemataceae bacterium]
MAQRSASDFGSIFFLQLALGAFFLALGIMGVTDYQHSTRGVMSLFAKNSALKLTTAIIELAMGGVLLLGLVFSVSSALARILGIVLFLLWAVYIVMNFIAKDIFEPSFVPWLYNISWNSVILVALWTVGTRYRA